MMNATSKRQRSIPCNIGCHAWCKKYFLEGPANNADMETALEEISDDDPWYQQVLVKHRRVVGILIPAALFHFCWWSVAVTYNIWPLFREKYYMSITMIFGSMIAGMTSEGGGAVAFPVMTLAFSISPSIARDFSLMIQSCGMSAAAFTIFFMRIHLEWFALIFCSLGSIVGIILGFHIIDPSLTPPQKKMGFVSIWFSFAFALFLLNLYHKRNTFKQIPDFKIWKGLILFITGFAGGIFSSFAGSWLDICSFSVITLLFRVTEKTATPTSVILMAFNTLVGFFWRQVILQEVSTDAWEYMFVCIPIVVIGAPLGSVIGCYLHRQTLAGLVYIIDTVALVGAFILVPQTKTLVIMSISIIAGGFIFFAVLTFLGAKLMENIDPLAQINNSLNCDSSKSQQNVNVNNLPQNDDTELKQDLTEIISNSNGGFSYDAEDVRF